MSNPNQYPGVTNIDAVRLARSNQDPTTVISLNRARGRRGAKTPVITPIRKKRDPTEPSYDCEILLDTASKVTEKHNEVIDQLDGLAYEAEKEFLYQLAYNLLYDFCPLDEIHRRCREYVEIVKKYHTDKKKKLAKLALGQARTAKHTDQPTNRIATVTHLVPR